MNLIIRLLLGLQVLAGFYSPSQAQLQQLRFDRLTIEQGLSHNYVMSMMQDHKGYLWFGTGNGLDKYDGYQFTHYQFDPSDSTTLPKNQVLTLWEDKEGVIWVGTSEGTCRFNPRTEKFTRLDKSAANPYAFKYAQSFAEDKEGNIWVGGSFEGELRQIDRRTGKFSATNYAEMLKPGLETAPNVSFTLHIIFKDRSGTLWMGSPYGLHRLELAAQGAGKPAKVSFTHFRHNPKDPRSLSSNQVAGIYEDKKGTLWITTLDGGLNALDAKSGQVTRYQLDPKRKVVIGGALKTPMTEDAAGSLWIGTNDGLYRLDKQRKEFTGYFHNPTDPASISNNNIWSILLDNAGILWVATAGGINKLDPHQKPFVTYRHDPYNPYSLSQNSIGAIVADKEGTVWVGTAGGGLNALNKKTGAFRQYRHHAQDVSSLRSDSIGALLVDTDGNLWVGNGKILSRFNQRTEEFRHYYFDHTFLNNDDGPPIFKLYEDRQKIIWLGTTNGILRFDPKTGKSISFPYNPNHPERMSDWWALTLLEDRKGNLWIGHGSQALDRFNPKTGAFKHYSYNRHQPGSISSNTVPSIYEDSKGNLWFGTGEGGLCHFNQNTEKFTVYTEKQGLAGNSVFSILEDNANNLWLGTNKGLSKFSLANQTFTNYDAADGLQSKLFTIRYVEGAAFKGKDGTLYFGGINGFNSFQPADIHANTYIPPVVITQFKLFDKPVLGKQEAPEIELDYDQNFFSLEFAALNYTSSNKNQYAYQLEGVDKAWVYSGTRRLASYTQVAPGDYVFKVKGSNNDGVWNEQGTSIRILINPPWWRTWWAYGFYFLCFLAGIIAVDRVQRQRLIQKEREKARERELEQAHEIEKAYKELKQTQTQLIQAEKMASLGELTAGIAHEIQNPLNFVNNFSEVSMELLEELKEERHKEPRDIELEDEIHQGIANNLQKVGDHGKRADAIVKGMLQHARTSTGEKQLTDINALTDEYLRLSYHGLRAKDKDFNATLITDFDTSIGKVEVVPQELGRVLLNLFNNAFYATQQKKNQLNGHYQPKVKVSTACHDGEIEIKVYDNGSGIPDEFKNKIFQPFFTTKPTGQGTGLGLSLSYDIITKGHGGELKVNTAEGEYSEFIVTLPIT